MEEEEEEEEEVEEGGEEGDEDKSSTIIDLSQKFGFLPENIQRNVTGDL